MPNIAQKIDKSLLKKGPLFESIPAMAMLIS